MMTGIMLPRSYLKWEELGITPAEGTLSQNTRSMAERLFADSKDIKKVFVSPNVSSASTIKANIKFYRLSLADKVCIEFAPEVVESN